MQKNLQGEKVPPREGYIFDHATGKLVDGRKPEEAVRQEYEKILEEDYDYELSQMDIEVFIQRGSKTSPKSEKDRADIVIYKTKYPAKRDQNQDILGIVEIKRPNKKDGIRQLESYMSASSALWGVWYNGSDKAYLYKNPETGEIKTDFVFQIPRKGETWDDIGRLTKKDLISASNLKAIFKVILNTLYANTNISRREKLGNEMIKLIFCKIWDERYFQNKPPKFRIGFTDNPAEVAKNVKELFEEVKKELSDDGVFDKHEEIKLEDKSIAIVVGELERYSLHETDKDVVGSAFEVFAESKLVGEKGEFFTPREVVKTAIKIVNPKPQQKVLDPACGSGGFLIYALENVWKNMDNDKKYKGSPNLEKIKQDIAEKTFFGIDKEPDLVKISKAYMAIVGDGRGGIVSQNTLHQPEDYEPRPKELFVQADNTFKKFDIIITNPPFGSKIKVLEDEAKHYDLGHVWKWDPSTGWIKTEKVKATEPQVLFVERCLQMLSDGGTLAIVLPETYFHAPEVRYVLEYIKKRSNIKAIIDLPHNTFRPHNNAKTILLMLEKGIAQGSKITFAVAEQMGHNHRGEDMYRYDSVTGKFTEEKWDDTVKIREEIDNPENPKNKYVFNINTEDIKNDVYVPRYYWNKKMEEIKGEAKKEGYTLIPMSQLIDEGIVKSYSGHGSPDAKFKGLGEDQVPYVRVADISNWMIYQNPTSLVPRDVYKKIKGKKGVTLQEKDILYVRRGSYRIGSVALVTEADREVLLTREITVFRVIKEQNKYNIDPCYLLFLLSHEITQKQLPNKIFIDTTLPNIGDRWTEIYLPLLNDISKVNEVKRAICEIYEKINAIKSSVEVLGKFGRITT
ncbi:MAG: N-6 DNA methylase [Candidatus Thermoplasmatota archaeon]|nr:N-6 DNA methylase [Candidatus Thermoplasmatota archaeon]